MKPFRSRSTVEQLADYLRNEILRGSLTGTMPGVKRLSKELGVGQRMLVGAMVLLEREGWLQGQGPRRRFLIVQPANSKADSLRVTILHMDDDVSQDSCVLDLHHHLVEAGHSVSFARKTLLELGMDVTRVAQFVKNMVTDAWVVMGGSQEILEWFAAQPLPVLALFGRFRGVSIAGVKPNIPPIYAAATRRLIECGHSRIALLTLPLRRIPDPGASERAFLEELEAQGIRSSSYNLPDWVDGTEGYERCLDALFRLTPPTALIIDGVSQFVAALTYFAQRNIRVPQDVSLICSKSSMEFDWCNPSVAHIHWDRRPVVNHVVRWVNKVACGTNDRHQKLTKAEFIDGGTLGLVKG